MNLHAIVRGAISAVNPDVIGTIRHANGYTTAPNGQRTPTYIDEIGVTIQEQALGAKELGHLDSLNIQGVLRGFWCFGDVQGANRPDQKGGDLIVVPSGTWLVVQVFETWSQDGWCHVAGQLQKS